MWKWSLLLLGGIYLLNQRNTIQLTVLNYTELSEKIIQCESGNNIWAINTKERHGSSYGVAQFRLSTFQEFGKKYNLPHSDIYNSSQQRVIMIRMLENGLGSKHWKICYMNAIDEFLNKNSNKAKEYEEIIEDMLRDGLKYNYAESTLIGILEFVERENSITDAQIKAVDNIKSKPNKLY